MVPKKIVKMFELSGFETYTEGDILVVGLDLDWRPDDFKAILICQNVNSESLLRERIRDIVEKNKTIQADKVILCLSGIEALGEDRMAAEQHDILIWEEDNMGDFSELYDEDKEKCRKKLYDELGIESFLDMEGKDLKPGRYS
jgi:hypothetical protein